MSSRPENRGGGTAEEGLWMGKATIAVGFRCCELEVASPTAQRKNGYIVWRCRCSCGGEILLDTRALQRGTITDCGCRTKVKSGQRDITGQRFGLLTAQYPLQTRDASGSMVWHCTCDCGGAADVPLHQLTSGCRKSCGCLSHPPRKDYVGRRFSKLLVIGYAGKQNGQHLWRCRCDCGNETVVRQTNLQSGKTKSCGCLQASQILENLKLCDGTSVAILEADRKSACAATPAVSRAPTAAGARRSGVRRSPSGARPIFSARTKTKRTPSRPANAARRCTRISLPGTTPRTSRRKGGREPHRRRYETELIRVLPAVPEAAAAGRMGRRTQSAPDAADGHLRQQARRLVALRKRAHLAGGRLQPDRRRRLPVLHGPEGARRV